MIPSQTLELLRRYSFVLTLERMPNDESLESAIGASFPAKNGVSENALERLKARYHGELQVNRETNRRLCISLPCPNVEDLDELTEIAEKLQDDIRQLFGIRARVWGVGYLTLRECLRMDIHSTQPQHRQHVEAEVRAH